MGKWKIALFASIILVSTILFPNSLIFALDPPSAPPPPPIPNRPLIQTNPPLPPGVSRVVFAHPRSEILPSTRGQNCPNPLLCLDYFHSRVKWANPSNIDVLINPANQYGLDINTVTSIITSAFSVWEKANISQRLNFNINVDSSTNPNPNSASGPNTVSFRQLNNPKTVAVTVVWFYTNTRNIIKFDLVFNADSGYLWSTNQMPEGCSEYPQDSCRFNPSSYDVGNIATHEIGHTLMLNDLYRSKDSELTMFGYAKPGELKKTTLGAGDIRGLNSLYP